MSTPQQESQSSSTPSLPPVVLPGQPLLSTSLALPGPGTTTHNSALISTLAGRPSLLPPSSPSPSSSSQGALPTLRVTPLSPPPSMPALNTPVLALITRITPLKANCHILLPVSSSTPIPGQIRVSDIRLHEKDKVRVYDSFRPGDVVRATVISLGDGGGWYLSTAGNDCGVVFARGEGEGGLGGGKGEGETLVPVSWKEMEGVRTGRRESRKVAKPV